MVSLEIVWGNEEIYVLEEKNRRAEKYVQNMPEHGRSHPTSRRPLSDPPRVPYLYVA